VGFIAIGKRAASHVADERIDHLIQREPAIEARQPLDLDRQTHLFAYLAHDRLPRRLARLDTAARQIPEVAVAPMTEQYAPRLIEDHCIRASRESHSRPPF